MEKNTIERETSERSVVERSGVGRRRLVLGGACVAAALAVSVAGPAGDSGYGSGATGGGQNGSVTAEAHAGPPHEPGAGGCSCPACCALQIDGIEVSASNAPGSSTDSAEESGDFSAGAR